MLNTILVPLDGSPLAARALPFATRLAKPPGTKLVLVRAYLPLDDALDLRARDLLGQPAEREQAERHQAEATLLASANRLRQQGLTVETVFVEGAAAGVIVDQARSSAADLVVMSTHGHGGLGRWVYGSVADEVLRTSPVPTLLVSAAVEHHWPVDRPTRALVTLDGSAFATEALEPASELLSALGGAELVLVGIVEPEADIYPDALVNVAVDSSAQRAQARSYLEDVARQARPTERQVSVQVGSGEPASTIVRIARERGADLIAMATHGRGGVARLVLGSVATRVLQQSPVPLLLVRPAALRSMGDTSTTHAGVAVPTVVGSAEAVGSDVL